MAKLKKDTKPVMLKEVTVTAKKKPMQMKPAKPDSTSVGYGAGKKTFSNMDIKMAVKKGQLKNVDTTNRNTISATVKGNSDKADYVANAVAKAKQPKKKK